MEADDDRARRAGQQHVRLGDGADAAVHHFDLHLGGRQLGQGVGQRFGRAALIRLDDDAERGHATLGGFGHEVFERLDAPGAAVLRLAFEALALLRDLARRRGIVHGEEAVARFRHTLEAEDLHRRGRSGIGFGATPLVVHRAHAP